MATFQPIQDPLIPYVIEQSPRGERSFDIYSRLLNDRVVFLGEEVTDASANSIVAQLLHIGAETEGAVIDTYQLVIGEEALPNSVDHLLGRDGQELPLTNGSDRLDLCGGGIDSVIGAQLEIVVLDAALDPEENKNNSDNNRNTYDELNVLRHT